MDQPRNPGNFRNAGALPNILVVCCGDGQQYPKRTTLSPTKLWIASQAELGTLLTGNAHYLSVGRREPSAVNWAGQEAPFLFADSLLQFLSENWLKSVKVRHPTLICVNQRHCRKKRRNASSTVMLSRAKDYHRDRLKNRSDIFPAKPSAFGGKDGSIG